MEYCGGGSLQDIYHGKKKTTAWAKTARKHWFIKSQVGVFDHLCVCLLLFHSHSHRASVRVTDSLHVSGDFAGIVFSPFIGITWMQ